MQYSTDFAERLLESAESLMPNEDKKNEAGRAVLYLSCVAMEISMKAILEDAGHTAKELKNISHDLTGLLAMVDKCVPRDGGVREISTLLGNEIYEPGNIKGAVKFILTGDIENASKYPNNIRYGDTVSHYHPVIMHRCATAVHRWCAGNMGKFVAKIS